MFTFIFRSEDRDRALQLCGWRFDKDTTALMSFLDRLEADGDYPRAAAIAIFNLRLRLAIDILNHGAQAQGKTDISHLNIVAMAVSGYLLNNA